MSPSRVSWPARVNVPTPRRTFVAVVWDATSGERGMVRSGALTRNCPQATSWPAAAHGSVAASTARTASHVSWVVGSKRRKLDNGCLAGRGLRHVEQPRGHLAAFLLEDPLESQVRKVAHLIAILDPQLVRSAGQQPNRLDHLLVLEQAGRRRTVREQQTVGDEVPVVDRLAEVAAVGEELAPSAGRVRRPWSIHSQTNPPWHRG